MASMSRSQSAALAKSVVNSMLCAAWAARSLSSKEPKPNRVRLHGLKRLRVDAQKALELGFGAFNRRIAPHPNNNIEPAIGRLKRDLASENPASCNGHFFDRHVISPLDDILRDFACEPDSAAQSLPEETLAAAEQPIQPEALHSISQKFKTEQIRYCVL